MRLVIALVLCLVIAFTLTGCSGSGLPPDRVEITKGEVCGGEVIWKDGIDLTQVASTGLCKSTVNVQGNSSEAGFTKSYYVQIHNTPLTAVKFDSEVDLLTLTDFAPLKKPLYQNSIDNVVSIQPSYLKPKSYDAEHDYLILEGFLSTAPITFAVEYYSTEAKTYSLHYAEPRAEVLEAGFSLPPPECVNWIDMPGNVTVPAFATKAAPVTMTVPPDVIQGATKFEFWIMVREVTPTEGVMVIDGVLKGVSQKAQYVQQWLVTLTE